MGENVRARAHTHTHTHTVKITVIRTRAPEGIKPSSYTPRFAVSAVGPERGWDGRALTLIFSQGPFASFYVLDFCVSSLLDKRFHGS